VCQLRTAANSPPRKSEPHTSETPPALLVRMPTVKMPVSSYAPRPSASPAAVAFARQRAHVAARGSGVTCASCELTSFGACAQRFQRRRSSTRFSVSAAVALALNGPGSCAYLRALGPTAWMGSCSSTGEELRRRSRQPPAHAPFIVTAIAAAAAVGCQPQRTSVRMRTPPSSRPPRAPAPRARAG